MLLAARRVSATTTHMLDALAFSAAANAAEFSIDNWGHLLECAIDRVFGAAANAAMDATAPLGLDIWDGVTYDDLPDAAVPEVLTYALRAASRFCDRTDERGTPIVELLTTNGGGLTTTI
jgi:enhancing lycopene biosynthesis protein 2